jgi:hypothetical protein
LLREKVQTRFFFRIFFRKLAPSTVWYENWD